MNEKIQGLFGKDGLALLKKHGIEVEGFDKIRNEERVIMSMGTPSYGRVRFHLPVCDEKREMLLWFPRDRYSSPFFEECGNDINALGGWDNLYKVWKEMLPTLRTVGVALLEQVIEEKLGKEIVKALKKDDVAVTDIYPNYPNDGTQIACLSFEIPMTGGYGFSINYSGSKDSFANEFQKFAKGLNPEEIAKKWVERAKYARDYNKGLRGAVEIKEKLEKTAEKLQSLVKKKSDIER